eukprot:358843-Chlamydomonas_euryale.AAC.1
MQHIQLCLLQSHPGCSRCCDQCNFASHLTHFAAIHTSTASSTASSEVPAHSGCFANADSMNVRKACTCVVLCPVLEMWEVWAVRAANGWQHGRCRMCILLHADDWWTHPSKRVIKREDVPAENRSDRATANVCQLASTWRSANRRLTGCHPLTTIQRAASLTHLIDGLHAQVDVPCTRIVPATDRACRHPQLS